jgi:aconitate hydratase
MAARPASATRGRSPEPVAQAVEDNKLVVAAVLSGNRNFEGRVNPLTRFNYLMSPPLVVAFALAGRVDIDFATEPLGVGTDGPVFLRDIWPAPADVDAEIMRSVKSEQFERQYANVFEGDEEWRTIEVPTGARYAWSEDSTYVKNPPYFEGMTMAPPGVRPITGARALGMFGDSITTDHISPAGNIAAASPAGKWLIAHGVPTKDFNSYGARRGNHEVMMRGTFANIRLRNELAAGKEGWWTATAPGGEPQPIFDVSMAMQQQGRRSSSSPARSTARAPHATGQPRAPRFSASEPSLRIVRADPSLESRGMGVLPLELSAGETRQTLGLTGFETFDVSGLDDSLRPRATLR